jgi:serine-type D-Ala-D-Ala carboxypeptidase (penicillin-binding protein 5/6)
VQLTYKNSKTPRQWIGLGTLAFIAVALAIGPAKAVETIAREAILVEVSTGKVLFEKNADRPMPPASMSKMMTTYMLFERLRDGRLSLEDTFKVSKNAWRKGGASSGSSTMFLLPGKRVKVEDIIRGIIIQSGNDACIVIAEALSGSEEAFAVEMTARGKELGMTNSSFKNATGWPHPDHLTTARDLAVLSQKLIKDFPEYYRYFSEKSFTYNGIKQSNRNPLLYKDMGSDGLKTGHTKESGYGLAASVERRDRRLILVINGLPSRKARSREPERIIEWGFREFENYKLFKAGDVVETAAVWLGQKPNVPLIIEKELVLTMPRKSRRQMKVTVSYEGPLPAPIKTGDVVGSLKVSAPGTKDVVVPLTAGGDIGRLGLVGRLGAAFNFIVWGETE